MFTGNIRKTENDSGLGFYKMAATFSEINVIFIGFLQTGKVELNVENHGGNHIRNFPGKKNRKTKLSNCLRGYRWPVCRSSRPEVFSKKSLLTNFKKLTAKHLCRSLFFSNFVTLLTKRLWHRCFSVNLTKFLRITL